MGYIQTEVPKYIVGAAGGSVQPYETSFYARIVAHCTYRSALYEWIEVKLNPKTMVYENMSNDSFPRKSWKQSDANPGSTKPEKDWIIHPLFEAGGHAKIKVGTVVEIKKGPDFEDYDAPDSTKPIRNTYYIVVDTSPQEVSFTPVTTQIARGWNQGAFVNYYHITGYPTDYVFKGSLVPTPQTSRVPDQKEKTRYYQQDLKPLPGLYIGEDKWNLEDVPIWNSWWDGKLPVLQDKNKDVVPTTPPIKETTSMQNTPSNPNGWIVAEAVGIREVTCMVTGTGIGIGQELPTLLYWTKKDQTTLENSTIEFGVLNNTNKVLSSGFLHVRYNEPINRWVPLSFDASSSLTVGPYTGCPTGFASGVASTTFVPTNLYFGNGLDIRSGISGSTSGLVSLNLSYYGGTGTGVITNECSPAALGSYAAGNTYSTSVGLSFNPPFIIQGVSGNSGLCAYGQVGLVTRTGAANWPSGGRVPYVLGPSVDGANLTTYNNINTNPYRAYVLCASLLFNCFGLFTGTGNNGSGYIGYRIPDMA